MGKMSNKRTVEVLRKAKTFIEKGWCKNYLALDSKGNEVLATSSDAVKWCAIGALEAVTRDNTEAWVALDRALPQNRPTGGVIGYNNAARSKHQVLRLFDRAIEMLG